MGRMVKKYYKIIILLFAYILSVDYWINIELLAELIVYSDSSEKSKAQNYWN